MAANEIYVRSARGTTKMRKINIERDIANDKMGNTKQFVPKLEELPTEIFYAKFGFNELCFD